MSKQKEYELVVDVRYIVKANNIHKAIEKWVRCGSKSGAIDSQRLLEIKEVK